MVVGELVPRREAHVGHDGAGLGGGGLHLDGPLLGSAELGPELCGVFSAASENEDLDVAADGVDAGRADGDGGVRGDDAGLHEVCGVCDDVELVDVVLVAGAGSRMDVTAHGRGGVDALVEGHMEHEVE